MSDAALLRDADDLHRLTRKPESQWQIVWRNFKRNRLAIVGGVVVVLLYLIAIFAPFLPIQDYAQLNSGQRLQPPGAEHWMGTDRQTRDVFARLIVASRISLAVGFVSVAIIMVLGVVLGAVAGYFGGFVDNLVMRVTDVFLAIPQLFLLLAAAALFTPSLRTTMLVIGFTSWMGTARLVRGEFLRVKAQEFVHAARSIGASNVRIMVRHLLPNTLAVIIVQATLWLSFAILLESSLSFLGLGAQPPEPSWGGMLADGRRDMREAWWMTTFPGLAIFITVLAFNLLGDGLRDAFDPRQRRR
ncbi:MAG TPA: ABC transporter permease [Thermomicrobiales bacterium]|nr:ABC transporter permease [Thermomicrobiales bacterium]